VIFQITNPGIQSKAFWKLTFVALGKKNKQRGGKK
jgi:hypothetical protein